MEQSTARFQQGEKVLLLSGEHEGQIGTVVASQEVEGSWQYGIAGIKGIGENLYAVHEHELNPPTEEDMVEPVFEPEPTINNGVVPSPVSSLASQLQGVANMAASQDQATHETFSRILHRLDSIDQKLEVKEIKVVVEVKYPTVEKKVKNRRAVEEETVEDVQLDFFTISEEE